MENKAINSIFIPTHDNSPGIKLNDIGFRLIFIPLFGIAIPLVTKLVDHTKFSNWEIKLSYLYTIGIAIIVWHGNRFLLFTLRSYFDWFNKPLRKVMALILVIPFFTIPVSVILLVGWYYLFENGVINWTTLYLNTLIIMIAVLFVVHVYETVFMVKEAESEKLQIVQIEKARAEAELEALKNQIDPHFIFNSLNTLSHLIEKNPAKAKLFNDNMADVYRYILQNKARDLVMLGEEIDFLNDYFSLQKIRFENAVMLTINVNSDLREQFLIPPISLQVLAENAIKHNEFTEAKPLMIRVEAGDHELVVSNNYQKKKLWKPTSKVGLENLNERYKLTTEKSIIISNTDSVFQVTLPVLNIS